MARRKSAHDLPQFKTAFLSIKDEDLGDLLLTFYTERWAKDHDLLGTDGNASLAEQILAEISGGVVSKIRYFALDKALKAAASGDAALAGNLAKQHLSRVELDSLMFQMLAYAKDQRLKGPIKGAHLSATIRREKTTVEHDRICGEAKKLRASGTPPRNVAGILAKRDSIKIGVRQIRTILKQCKENQ